MSPKRIQMSRQHPWRAENPDAVIVARPSKWGNPYEVRRHNATTWEITRDGDYVGTADTQRSASHDAAERFADYLIETPVPSLLDIDELAGRDLACWCPPDEPCHGDVLLERANPTT